MTDRRRAVGRREAAEILGVGVDTVTKMIRRGELRTVKIGDVPKITMASINAVLDPPAVS
jgi:excisionase family DNA binding protein